MVKKALLIGINYKNTEIELKGCINDTLNIQNFLTKYCLFDHIHILTDDTEIKPFYSNIQIEIEWLVSNNEKGDSLVFYYAGHGSNVQDLNGDESDGRDESIVPLDFHSSGLIKDDYLFSNLISKVINGVNLWCFSDCCHSGSIVDLKYNFKCSTSLKKEKTITYSSYIPLDWTDNFELSLENSKDVPGNICLLSGCRDIEFATDINIENKNQGAFTFCLLKILHNNITIVDDIKRYKSRTLKLRNLLKEINVRLLMNGFTEQQSQLSLSKIEDIEGTLDL
jgi:hypothetical protein